MADEKTEVENGNAEITKEDLVTAVEQMGAQAVTAREESHTAVAESVEVHEELEEHKDKFKEALDAIDSKFSVMQSSLAELSDKVSDFIESSKKVEVIEKNETGDLPIIEVNPEPKKEEVKPEKRKRFFI